MKILILAVCIAVAAAHDERGLTDFLASATKGTKLGAAFEVINAFGKVSKFIDDLKSIAPAAHAALTDSINAIKDTMNNVTSKLVGEVKSSLGKRGLADFLASATKGTKLGAAFDVINAFGKVSKFIDDLKSIAPAAHAALTDSINAIKDTMNNVTSKLVGEVKSSLGKRGLTDFLASATKGTKLGAAFEVIDAFGKVSKFIDDLKSIAPAAHAALTDSINAIKDTMNNVTSKLVGEVKSSLGKRGLADFLASATKGTKLGAAFDVINAFGKVSKFIDDLKSIAPAAHAALTDSINAIKDTMNNVTSKLVGEVKSSLGKRGLADFLASATKGTKLGAAFEVINAFGKVSKFIDDLKSIAPAAHAALTDSINAIKDTMNNVTSKLVGEVKSSLGKRGLADFLASATKGTKLGAAFEVINAFGKVSKFIDDLKSIAPAAHAALTDSINAIKDTMNNVTSKLVGEVKSSLGKRGLADFLASATKGTKLGAAFDVINAFGKVSKFIDDLKSIAPAAHAALTDSINAIKDTMNNVTSKLVGEVKSSLGKRGLADFLASATKGTKLGAAFEVINAFGKVSKFIDDLKSIAPAAHAALTDSINAIKDTMNNVTSKLVGEVKSSLGKRGIADFLASATKGTKLGTAFEVIKAFEKVSQLISDVKTIAPAAHAALTDSIHDIEGEFKSIVSKLIHAV